MSLVPWFLHFCDLTLSVVPHDSAKGLSRVPERRETEGPDGENTCVQQAPVRPEAHCCWPWVHCS